MKKIFLVMCVLMVISSIVLAGGTENPSPASEISFIKYGEILKVFYKANEVNKVKVTIFNDRGSVVFTDGVKRMSGFMRPYNLSGLPDGNYRVVVEDKNGSREEIINHSKPVNEVLSSVIHARGLQKCMVTLFSKGETSITVAIKDQNNRVLSTDSYQVNGQSLKLLDIKNRKGPILVEIFDQTGIINSTRIQ